MSVIAATAINNDEDLTLDKKTWDKLKQIDIDEAQAYMPDDSSEEEENLQELRYKFHTDGGEDKFAALDQKGDDDSDSISEDEAITRVDRMAMEIDDSLRAQKEYAMLIDKKEAKKSRKAKALVDLHRQKKMDESDDEKLANQDILATTAAAEDSENDNDLEEERELQKIMKEQRQLKKQKI